jgi:hypothetical protein
MRLMTMRSLNILLLVLLSGGALAEGRHREEVRALRDTTDLKQIRGGAPVIECSKTLSFKCGKVGITKLCEQTPCGNHPKTDEPYCKLVTQKRSQALGWKECESTMSLDKGWQDCDTVTHDAIDCYWIQDCAGDPEGDGRGCDYVRRVERRGWWCRSGGIVDYLDEHAWSQAAGKLCPVKKGS